MKRRAIPEVGHPAKRLAGLSLQDRPQNLEIEEVPEFMSGVNEPDLIVIDRDAMNLALNDIEVDDRFIKIPRTISAPRRKKPQANALIRYSPPLNLSDTPNASMELDP